jgi:hypothetical protein
MDHLAGVEGYRSVQGIAMTSANIPQPHIVTPLGAG